MGNHTDSSTINKNPVSSFSNASSRLHYRRFRSPSPRFKIILLLSTFAFLCLQISSMDWSFYTTPKLDFKTGLDSFPMELEDFAGIVDLYRNGKLNESLAKPINLRYSSVNFLVSPPTVHSNLDILVIVKSARNNFWKRDIIRQTWGNPKYLEEKAFSSLNLSTRIFFICGQSDLKAEDVDLHLKAESNFDKDLIIANFNDSYYNNTYKSILAFKWALTEFAGDFKYLALFDDDVYVDMVNMGAFLKDLKEKRRVIKTESPYSGFPYFQSTFEVHENTLAVGDISNGVFIGSVYYGSIPNRNPEKKWFSSYNDYPYNMFPPYIPGAGIILDYKAVSDIYYASVFVRHFWIDDVYLGIIAAKLGIIPFHNDNFQASLIPNWNLSQDQISQLIMLHGLNCSDQLLDFWHKRTFKDLVDCPI